MSEGNVVSGALSAVNKDKNAVLKGATIVPSGAPNVVLIETTGVNKEEARAQSLATAEIPDAELLRMNVAIGRSSALSAGRRAIVGTTIVETAMRGIIPRQATIGRCSAPGSANRLVNNSARARSVVNVGLIVRIGGTIAARTAESVVMIVVQIAAIAVMTDAIIDVIAATTVMIAAATAMMTDAAKNAEPNAAVKPIAKGIARDAAISAGRIAIVLIATVIVTAAMTNGVKIAVISVMTACATKATARVANTVTTQLDITGLCIIPVMIRSAGSL